MRAAFIVAVLLLAGSSKAEGQENLGSLLGGARELLLYRGSHPCALVTEREEWRDTAVRLVVYSFERLAAEAAVQKTWVMELPGTATVDQLAEIRRECPAALLPTLELGLAACQPDDSFRLRLQEHHSFVLRLPTSRDLTTGDGSNEDRSGPVGCAWRVTSSDGKLRLWQQDAEVIPDNDSGSDTVVRGRAFLQWEDVNGTHTVGGAVGANDFHIDATIRSIDLIEGTPSAYLITGVRTYRTTRPGNRARLFAEVIRVGRLPELVTGTFRKGRRAQSRLVLTAPAPAGGKFGSSALSSHQLVMRQGRLLLVERFKDAANDNPLPVAECKGAYCSLVAKQWGEISIAEGFAELPERRWAPLVEGAAAEE